MHRQAMLRKTPLDNAVADTPTKQTEEFQRNLEEIKRKRREQEELAEKLMKQDKERKQRKLSDKERRF